MEGQTWSREVLPGFIVFEGLDGAGTTTQARRLVTYLAENGSAEFTCEPTDFATGRLIRRLLTGPEQVEPETLALLFAADRQEHLSRPMTGIRARVAAGSTVVCDRYLFSSLAYQGVLTDPQFVARLNAPFPMPQHLVFIDTPVDEAYRRMENRWSDGQSSADALEQRPVQERVAPRYRAVIDEFSRMPPVTAGEMHVHRIDGSLSAEEVFQSIVNALF